MSKFHVKSVPPDDVNTDVLSLTNQAVQAQERLHLRLKASKDKYSQEAVQRSIQTVDSLRLIKAEVEQSHYDFVSMKINNCSLIELKQLTLMHVPSSITEEAKTKFQDLIFKNFEGNCKKLLCAVLLTCPWYWATQKERGEQARHNSVFVVYLSSDEQFFSPTNPHTREQGDVIDEGWLYGTELSRFTEFLVKGKTRFVEALYCPEEAILYEDDGWKWLRENLDYKLVMKLPGFVEACRGQSVGGIGKLSKAGKFRMKDSATFHELCDSFRLMTHAQNTASELPPCTTELNFNRLPKVAKESGKKLTSLYQDPDVSRTEIFNLLVSWRDEVNVELQKIKRTDTQEVEGIVGNWQKDIRLQGRTLNVPSYVNDDHSSLVSLMEKIGEPVSKMRPEQILLVARAGSYMYGLSTPESDVDYVIIYSEPTEKILTSCRKIPDNFESRGPKKLFEYGAYEARLFCEMLLKGSVVILELVFTDTHEYMNPAWKALSQYKQQFVTERAIQQYLGLIRNNFRSMDSTKKDKHTNKDHKLFYQVFHKLESLQYLLKGEAPPVCCTGEVQKFIMKIRTEKFKGDMDRDALYTLCHEKYDKLLEDLVGRETRLKENVDYRFVTNWLIAVRGIVDPV